jgi:hypothetical protein
MRTRLVLAATTALLAPGAAVLWNSIDRPHPSAVSAAPIEPVAPAGVEAPAPAPVAAVAAEPRASARRRVAATVPVADTPATPPPAAAGMVVAIDPETGQLGMPTSEQLLELSPLEMNAASRSSEGLHEIALPGGGFAIDLQGRFQEFVIVETGPDGRLRQRCVDDHAAQSARRVTAPVLWEER